MFDSSSRYLIVDDSRNFRGIVMEALAELGLKRIDEAPDGKSAYRIILEASEAHDPYALVFCDIHMPHLDGLRLLEMLRGDPKTRDIPVIMVTTESSKQAVVRAAMTGIAGYVVKPFGVGDVKRKIQEVYHQFVRKNSE